MTHSPCQLVDVFVAFTEHGTIWWAIDDHGHLLRRQPPNEHGYPFGYINTRGEVTPEVEINAAKQVLRILNGRVDSGLWPLVKYFGFSRPASDLAINLDGVDLDLIHIWSKQ